MRDQPRSMAFSVIEASSLFYLPLSRVRDIARMSLACQRSVMMMSEYGMDMALAALGVLLLRATDKRVAATLLHAAPDGQPLRLTQAQLGEMANAERQVVNRVLKALAVRGWLTLGYGQVTVTDRAGLEAFVRG
ncbi:MAG: Crp/Fnr family transcriptional regulator [Exiguobacterium profundum]|nr:MAG: Crp/Fnr family transcriptional regulator [Exiguobacterium profundum]